MIRVFVTGASGNVGRTIVRTMRDRDGFELSGGWCLETGEDLGVLAGIEPVHVKSSATLDEGLSLSMPDIVIDFSVAGILEGNMKSYIKAGLNAVIGATGLSEEQLETFRKEVAAKGLRWAVIPNFGLGISLVSDFIKKVRQFYPYVSITDQHTNEMANAPSGTAVALAHAASEAPFGPVASRETYPGVMGGHIHGVQVLSRRLPFPGPYSEHEITLARKDEIIRITVQDHTSDVYMDGVFLTAEKLSGFPEGTFLRSMSEVMESCML